MNAAADAPLGLLSFLSFAFSVIAAVLAIDMYKLLRTGEFGKTWRLLIIASVMLALLQVLRMAEILNIKPIADVHLTQIVELCFVMSLAYAFYVQRKLFTHEYKRLPRETDEDAVENLGENLSGEDDEIEAPDSVSQTPLISAPDSHWDKNQSPDISRPNS